MHQRSIKEVQRPHRLERETERHRSVMVIPGFLWAWSFTWHPSTCLVNRKQSQNCLILKVQTKPGKTWVKGTKQEHPGVLKILSVSTLKPERAENKNSITSSWSSHALHGLDLGTHVKKLWSYRFIFRLFSTNSGLAKADPLQRKVPSVRISKNYHRWNTIKHRILTESQKIQWNKPLSVWNQTHQAQTPIKDACK